MLKGEFPTSAEWLKLLKKEKNLTSDYQLSKYLGLTQQAVSSLMLGKSVMSDTTALKVADSLGYSHLLLISVFLYRSLHITFNVIFITVNKSLWLLLVKACFYIRIINELF